jgi:hypothetical protein
MRTSLIAVVTLLALASGAATAAARPKTAAKRVPHYTQQEAFRHFMKTHQDPMWRPRSLLVSGAEGEQLLHATWFTTQRTNVAMHLVVSLGGAVVDHRSVYAVGLRLGRAGK